AEKLHYADGGALVEMSELAAPQHLLEEDAVVAFDDFCVGGIRQQALVGNGALESFTESGARQEQVLHHLTLEDRKMRTEMQADHGIAGHHFHRLPEPFLGVMRGTQLRQVEDGFVDTDLC